MDILNRLRSAGLSVTVDGDRLVVRGPRGAMTPELAETIRRHKRKLLQWAGTPDDYSSPENTRKTSSGIVRPSADGEQSSSEETELLAWFERNAERIPRR